MNGKTHYKVGAMYYTLFASVPVLASSPLGSGGKMTVLGIGAAMFGALVVDADTQSGSINQTNPGTAIPNMLVDTTANILKSLIRFLLFAGAGTAVIIYSDNIKLLHGISGTRPYTTLITYSMAAFLFLLSVAGEKMAAKLPIINIFYSVAGRIMDKSATAIKKLFRIGFYVGLGTSLIIYNSMEQINIVVYMAGLLLITIPFLRHRMFLHSIEGLVILSTVLGYTVLKLNYGYLQIPIVIGIISHLYLCDLFTNSGVPVSGILLYLLEKTGIHERLENKKAYFIFYRILSARLKIPLTSTGTAIGNLFEYIYVLLLAVIVAISFIKYGMPDIRLM